ncbi:DUF2971 domain-containing protein [Ignatzschineria rhizosphaerae]|uniref:DUF2971 domain-containing protein n=1 Tax=Ignatzschineria rhizosphaerae TaxID=2923279 RepID=A0ABY3X1K1_9GAMM|nr:DUF2971 domain-containing protein [Ignatzschineria rhizosphaerae]UNM96758.1 DUF2971 domain-containing protein [Ignatzschineria rhizosphaerae]
MGKVYKYRYGYTPVDIPEGLTEDQIQKKLNQQNNEKEIFERDLSCVKNNQVYFSPYEALNDPTEGYISKEEIKRELDNFEQGMIEVMLNGESKTIDNEIFKLMEPAEGSVYPLEKTLRYSLKKLRKRNSPRKALEKFYQEKTNNFSDRMRIIDEYKQGVYENLSMVLKSYGILSLSLTYDNILMWAHYANSHKGYVLEYDKEKLLQNLIINKDLYNFMIKYGNEVPSFKLRELIFDANNPQDRGMKAKNILEKFWSYKAKPWAYEEEFRIIIEGQGIRYHYKKALTGVYFGLRMNDELKTKMEEALKGRGIKFYDMTHKENSYEFDKPILRPKLS